eukprot:CAMPEP_0176267646 /NCGR_PEP_ID=MMETSP0121_2-20121125/43266_1 /TAXON_ID=160619 /ORGANISM="Kryptoperidinium foliaceum, Strain CCMP 1326" /LENGTH=77 /DNA_ID=CAMNT_0017607715 /DNA_START=34 /DNA_END=267 /DNA_ORIENTATION=-
MPPRVWAARWFRQTPPIAQPMRPPSGAIEGHRRRLSAAVAGRRAGERVPRSGASARASGCVPSLVRSVVNSVQPGGL